MSVYPPPTRNTSIFNSTDFGATTSTTVTQTFVDTYYLKKAGGQTVLALETFQGGIATNSITPYAGTTIDFGSNNLTTTGTGSVGSLSVSGAVNSGSLSVSGAVTTGSYTSWNTSSTTVGYTVSSSTGSVVSVTSATATKVNSSNLTLTPGIWFVQMWVQLGSGGTAGGVSVTNVSLGFNNSATTAFPTFSSTAGGYRYIYDPSSTYTPATGTSSTWPVLEYSQIIQVTSTMTNFYGVMQATWSITSGTTSLTLRDVSSVQATRIA